MPARQGQAGSERRRVVVINLDVDDPDPAVGDVEDGVALDRRHGIGEGTALRRDKGGLAVGQELQPSLREDVQARFDIGEDGPPVSS